MVTPIYQDQIYIYIYLRLKSDAIFFCECGFLPWLPQKFPFGAVEIYGPCLGDLRPPGTTFATTAQGLFFPTDGRPGWLESGESGDFHGWNAGTFRVELC